MNSNENNKSRHFLTTVVVLIIGVLGGLIGAAVYFYAMGQYYNTENLIDPELSQRFGSGSNLIIREPKKVIVEQDTKAIETVNSVSRQLMGVFLQNEADRYALNQAVGQALILTSDGWLVSNLSAESDWQNLVLVSQDLQIYEVADVVHDELSGFSFIKLDGANSLPVVRFGQWESIALGQLVLGVNWPEHSWSGRVRSKYDKGAIVSSDQLLRQIELTSTVEPDYLALANLGGEVVGLVNTGGKLVDADHFQLALNSLLNSEPISFPELGVYYQDLAYVAGDGYDKGALITSPDEATPAVKPGSPAAKAKLQAGDIILSIDGVELSRQHPLNEVVAGYEAGAKVVIKYNRGEELLEAKVTLVAQ